MGKLANNYVQPLCILNDAYINPPPLPRPGTVSLMQAILHHCLKKRPPSIMAFTHFDFYQYSVMGRWMLSNYNHTTSVFWRTVSKKRRWGGRNCMMVNVQLSCLLLQGLTAFLSFFFCSFSVPACFCSVQKEKREMRWKKTWLSERLRIVTSQFSRWSFQRRKKEWVKFVKLGTS